MILKFLRVLKIIRVAIRYGLDEIAIASLAIPRTAKLIDTLIFLLAGYFCAARRAIAPRTGRSRTDFREVRPGAVDPAGSVAGRYCQ